ncbi:MAG: RHS repeat-associated core domain-containing protein [Planctomycetaceae bacterium]|nr:RHS repeat-associated core domain-containing protein [Planctomycetaceae bacterium]
MRHSVDDAGRTMNTNTPNGATAGVPGFNEYGYVGGLRVWKKITRNGSTFEHRVYIHTGPNLFAEYNAGVAASTPVQEYVYADQIDSLVMIHRSNNQRLGVTRNRQWSVVGSHDLANGNIVERYAYDISGKRTIYAPDGTTVRTTSSFGNNFGYTNRWHDEESGLINFRARYYNPLTGEFLRRDPAGFVDGMSLYRGYMDVNYVDPSGLQTVRCRCYSGWLDGDVFGSTTDVQVECDRVLDDCCKKACRLLGGWTGTYTAQNTETFSNPKYEEYLFSYEAKHPHDPVDLWLTRAKLGAFGIAGIAGSGAVIGYGISTYGVYGLGAIVLKEAGDAAKDAVLESTIGFSPPTGIRGGVKSIRDFFGKFWKKRLKPLNSEVTGEAIDPERLARMKAAYERQGGTIHQSPEIDDFMKRNEIEGRTYDSETIFLPQEPTTSAVFEEFIHVTQFRKGRADKLVEEFGPDEAARLLEIEAQETLIRNQKAWKIPDSENTQTIERLQYLRSCGGGL